jgi:hypothetical protein
MHHSRLCAILIDCKTADVDKAACFWAAALGRPVDFDHPMSRGNYRMLETRLDEVNIEIQRVEHESRAHIDIEADDIPAEVRRLEKLGATAVNRLKRWVVMQAPTGQRFWSCGYSAAGSPRRRTAGISDAGSLAIFAAIHSASSIAAVTGFPTAARPDPDFSEQDRRGRCLLLSKMQA